MYTEEYEKRGFPIGNFIIKLILIIIFVFLLVWLLPKFLAPKVTNNYNTNSSKSTPACTSEKCDLTGLDALTSQIFMDNLDRMKSAAISYYTDEKLPTEVGQSKTMTLSDMIGQHLIVPLIDKNNKACDVEKSYVKITKADDEYILKVNLKDSEKEDYILVHLGCYTYCDSYLCQKQGTEVPTKGATNNGYVPIKGAKDDGVYYPPSNPTPVVPAKPSNPICGYQNGRYYDSYGNVVSKVDYVKSCIPTVVEEHYYCMKHDGKYYGYDGTVVSESEFKNQCTTKIEKYYCMKYNGRYYGKNGDIVSENEFRNQCVTIEEHYYCMKHDGKYYGKNGDVVSFEDYKNQCFTIEEHYYCTKHDGKYYGKNGDVVSEAEYKKQCETKVEYLYEYKKTTSTKTSDWTPWSSWSKADCSTAEINCSDSDNTCLMKLQMLKRKEQIGTYEKTYAKQRDMIVQTGSYTARSCSKYNYVEINKTIYATTTTTTYTRTNTITSSTKQSSGGWTYNGPVVYANPPRDTATTHYKYVGADYSECEITCSTTPKYIYDSYTYTGGLYSVSSTTSAASGAVSASTSSSTTSQTTNIGSQMSCGEYVYKTIPVYATVTVSEKAKRTEPLYGTVCYKSTKTRTLVSSGKTETKWSTYNDTSLLNSGWSYTGNKKVK